MTFSIDNPEGGLQQPPLRKICLGKTLRRTRVKAAVYWMSQCANPFLHIDVHKFDLLYLTWVHLMRKFQSYDLKRNFRRETQFCNVLQLLCH